jgi:ketosteroid isomerase-like protein
MYHVAMHKIIFFMLIVMALGCAGPGADQAQQTGTAMPLQQAEQEVRQAESDWAGAVIAGDLNKIAAMYHDRLIYAHSSGIVESKDEYLGKLREGATRYDAIDHEALEIRAYDGAVVAHARVVMRGENAQGAFHNRLMMIHVWVHEGGVWLLVAHQTTQLEAVG